MRFNEFDKDARKQLAEKHNMSEEQLDEILPAIGAIGAGLARVGAGAAKAAVKGGAALARGAAKAAGAAARGVGAAARGAGRAVARGAQNAARQSMIDPGPATKATNGPNSTVGTQSSSGPALDADTQKQLDKKLKPGKTIDLPAAGAGGKPGPTKKFKVTRNAKGEVELQNPLQKPGEPKKFVYNKDELAGILDAN